MAAFAAQDVRKEQDKLNKYQEENQIKENHELELLLRNISKKNQKNEFKDLELPYEVKKAKDGSPKHVVI